MIDWLAGVWGFLKSLTWTEAEQVVASLIGALVGAWAGAWAARSGAAADKERDSLMGEINGVNAAGSLCFMISNVALSLKKQHVKEMKETFDKARNECEEHLRRAAAGERMAVYEFRADLNTLPLMNFPTQELRSIALDRLTLPPRGMAAVMQLHQLSIQLDVSLHRRNSFIEETRRKKAAGVEPITPYNYFGIKDKAGHTDMDYSDTLTAIATLTDDAIFFSALLAEDLNAHGEKTRRRLRKPFPFSLLQRLPTVRKADFARAGDLMPPRKNYEDWLSAFPPPPTIADRLRKLFKRS